MKAVVFRCAWISLSVLVVILQVNLTYKLQSDHHLAARLTTWVQKGDSSLSCMIGRVIYYFNVGL